MTSLNQKQLEEMLETIGNDRTKLRVVIVRADAESTDLFEAAHLINRTLRAKFISALTYIVTKSDAFMYSAYDFIIRLSMLDGKITTNLESCLAASVTQTKVNNQQKETTMTQFPTTEEGLITALTTLLSDMLKRATPETPLYVGLQLLPACPTPKSFMLKLNDLILNSYLANRNDVNVQMLGENAAHTNCHVQINWISDTLDNISGAIVTCRGSTTEQFTLRIAYNYSPKKKEIMKVNTSPVTDSYTVTDLDVITKHVTDATAFKEIMPETLMFVDQETVVVINKTGAVVTKAEDIDKLNEQVLTMETRLPNLIDGKNEAFKFIAVLKQERDQQTAEQVKPEETKLHGTPRWGYGDNSGLNTAPSMPETKPEEQPLNPESPDVAKVSESPLSEYRKHLTLWRKRLQVSLDEVKTSAPPNFTFVTAQQAAIAAVIRPDVATHLGGSDINYDQAGWLSVAIADVVCVLINDTDDVLSEVVPVSIWFARLSHVSARPRPKKMIDLVKANQKYFNHKVVQLLTARANTQVV